MSLPATTFTNLFQAAYVTRDLDQAIAHFQKRHSGAVFTSIPAQGLELRIPAATASMKVAVAWIGDTQIELIEPVDGAVDIYRRALPDSGDVVAFHHLGMRITGERTAWESFRESVADADVAIEGGRQEMRFIYTDERATLGHYLEYVWMSDAFVRANPVWAGPTASAA